jgi:DNA-binding response OmpR family regulator
MGCVSSVASGWQFPSSVHRVWLNFREQIGSRLLSETRYALAGAFGAHVRLAEVKHGADLYLITGAAEWAEGFTRKSRGVGDPTPIVVRNVTPINGWNARILDAGADECLACPFDADDLRARIQAVMRRLRPALLRSPEIAADPATLRIRVRDVETRVSRRQFEIFVYLAENRERWVHSNEIIAAVSGTHHDPATSLVRVQMHALRKALGAARECIRSDGHKSYMLTLSASDR